MSEIITITGSSGFVGTNIIKYLKNFYSIKTLSLRYIDNQEIKIDSEFIIHLAGKAHDLKKVDNIQDYYNANYKLTKQLFDAFLVSKAVVFIFISSVKAVADSIKENEILFENAKTDPQTHYGKSKLLAEKYILSKEIPEAKRVIIIRPSMIYGPGNKGNLNLLYKLVQKGIPWPLGAFENQRSFCSIDNLSYVIDKIIKNVNIPSGIYNISDDQSISTNEIISLIATSKNKKTRILLISKNLIFGLARIGDIFKLPLNSENIKKLTENFVVSNTKIKTALKIKSLPFSTIEAMIKTFDTF
jgi:nucleoside-diphosphate-sugar epimerase